MVMTKVMVTMTMTMTKCCVKLLSVCWVVASVGLIHVRAQQNVGCGVLETQYALTSLANVSVGLSRDLLPSVVLPPFLQQPRVPSTPGSTRARVHIKQWMQTAGWTVEEDSFLAHTPVGQRRFTNVVATLNPNRARRLVLACHYDSKRMPEAARPFVGAIDSAVPCSLLMESAWLLHDHFRRAREDRSRTPHGGGAGAASNLTLQFVFFDGEEALVRWSSHDSLYGARHLANLWSNTPDPNHPGRNKLQNIETLILLDLIGTADTHFRIRYPQTAGVYSKLHNIELCLAANGYLKATRNTSPLFTTMHDYSTVEDDHLPFLRRGVPVVHLITHPFPWVWHTVYDDGNALDYNRIENLARILRLFFVDLPL